MPRTGSFIAAAGLIAEVFGAGYVGLVAWLIGAWMVSDSVAFRMVPSDWYVEAVVRFFQASIIAAVFGIVAHFFNGWALASRPGIAKLLTWVVFGGIWIAGLAGAVDFAVRKPYM
jgi:small-conductance mechanosensitive channel